MATLGHVAVGLAAGRWEHGRARPMGPLVLGMAVYAGLSLLPDLDVIGFRFGVAYVAEWGHRGASHSFAFGLLVAALFASFVGAWERPWGRTFVLSALVVSSHGVLDAMTDGGLGAALLWPLSNQRYFAPFTPIPVGPIGRRMFSMWGARVVLVETLCFAPLLLYALWPRRRLQQPRTS